VGQGSPPEAEKLFPFAHPAEAANLSYFLFICSIPVRDVHYRFATVGRLRIVAFRDE